MVRLYVDTVIVIEAVERDQSTSAEIVFDLREEVVSSEMTLAEVLVAPIRAQNPELCGIYELLFDNATKTIDARPVTRAILTRAAALRARHGRLKLFDAIHLSTAIDAGCSHFVTNDRDLLKIVEKEWTERAGPSPLAADAHDRDALREALRS